MKTFLIIPILMSKLMGDGPQTMGMQALHATGGSGIVGAMSLHWNIGEIVAIQAISLSNILLTRSLLQPDTMYHPPLPVTKLSGTATLIKNDAAL